SSQIFPCATDEIFDDITGICICNLSMYSSTVLPPNPTLRCLSGQIRLNVSRCQLERSGYDSSKLHLMDSSCVGQRVVEDVAEIVVSTNPFSSACGNVMTVNDSHVIYSNNLNIPAKVFMSGVLTRNNISIGFDCSYPLMMPVSLFSIMNPAIGFIELNVHGVNTIMKPTMTAFIDSNFTVPYNESSMYLYTSNPLYLSMRLPEFEFLYLLVKRMYATTINDLNAVPQFDLITDGCPSLDMNDLVSVVHNGDSYQAQFVIQVFQITGSDSVYFFADVETCMETCT
ncbi:hypothetical protein NDU88_001526, partial [Pleurodeles waltl]